MNAEGSLSQNPKSFIKAEREYIFNETDKKFYIRDEKLNTIPPDNLFKYYSLSNYNVDAFINEYIYASEGRELNDPFDCNHDLIGLETFDELFPFLNQFFDDKSNPNFREDEKKRWDDNPQELKSEYKFIITGWFFKHVGVLSLTTKNDNLLMWTHYTNNKGFALDFKYKLFPIDKKIDYQGPFPINYRTEIEKLDINDYNKSSYCFFHYLTNVKSKQWDYEDEWRILCQKRGGFMKLPGYGDDGTDRNFTYIKDCINGIYLAYDFFSYKKEEYMLNDNGTITVKIIFTNESLLRKCLLDGIIDKGYNSYWMKRDTSQFNLIPKPIKITRNEPYDYTITSLG